MTQKLWQFQEAVDKALTSADAESEKFIRAVMATLCGGRMPLPLLLELAQRVIDYNRAEWKEYNAEQAEQK